MIIVLINWRILEGFEGKFLQSWKTDFKLGNPKGLVGEFISKVEGPAYFDKINWEMESSSHEDTSIWKSQRHVSFVNVGVWDTLENFNSAVGHLMNRDSRDMKEFEAAPRRRAVLSPEAWRIGEGKLPSSSSTGIVA